MPHQPHKTTLLVFNYNNGYISYHFRDKASYCYWLKIAIFHTAWAFNAPIREVPVKILPNCFIQENQNGVATQQCKTFDDMFSHFDRISKYK